MRVRFAAAVRIVRGSCRGRQATANRLRAATVLSCVSIVGIAVLASVTGCVQEPPPFDPRQAQDFERAAEGNVQPRPMYPLPTTLQTKYAAGETEPRAMTPQPTANLPEGPTIRMSLEEAIHRAINNSLDIRVASYDTAVDQTRVMEAEARFDPSLFVNGSFERVDKESPGTFTNFDPVFDTTTKLADFAQSDTTTVQWGFQENLPAGGQAKLQYQVQNVYTNPQQYPIATYYENELSLQVTQPLLQNFGVEVNAARITISRNNQRVSMLDFRKTVEDTVLKLEQLWWQLVQTRQDLATLERLVQASEETTRLLFRRQGQDVTAVQIDQANAATASRRVQLRQIRQRVGDLSDQIKRQMDDPEFPVSSSMLIDPTDAGTDAPLVFDESEQINAALDNRLELGQQQVRIDSSEVATRVAKNNLLPQLNFQGSVTSDGVAHSLGNGFSNQSDFNHIGYAAGLQLTVPLGNREARAIWQRALIQREQAIFAYKQIEEQATEDVKAALRGIDSSWDQLGLARLSRIAAADTLNGFRQQQDSGALPYTPDNVQLRLQFQATLAVAEQEEHRASNDYNFAIVSLEKAKGTILRYNNVMLEEAPIPVGMTVRHPSSFGNTKAYGPGKYSTTGAE